VVFTTDEAQLFDSNLKAKLGWGSEYRWFRRWALTSIGCTLLHHDSGLSQDQLGFFFFRLVKTPRYTSEYPPRSIRSPRETNLERFILTKSKLDKGFSSSTSMRIACSKLVSILAIVTAASEYSTASSDSIWWHGEALKMQQWLRLKRVQEQRSRRCSADQK